MSKHEQNKKVPRNVWIRTWPPRPPLEKIQTEADFFLQMASLRKRLDVYYTHFTGVSCIHWQELCAMLVNFVLYLPIVQSVLYSGRLLCSV